MTKESLGDETFHQQILFADKYFLQEGFRLLCSFFCLKLNALDVKFWFLPYFMTENPTETERNVIICPFYRCFIVFLLLISLKVSRYFNTLWIKNCRQKV